MSHVRLCRLGELPEGELQARTLGDGRRLALLRRDERVFVFSDCCTHEEASLAEGYVDGFFVECPRHGATFDVRTGKVLALPATRDLATFPVRLEGDEVWVDVGSDERSEP